jgi:hypothetical protein
MGFWGSYVVHRDEELLWQLLPEVPELRDGELQYDQVSGGWQITRIRASSSDLPETFLTDLRDATGAPVLTADIMDSSAAYVHAVGVRTPFWDTWLKIESAVAYSVLPESPFDDDGNYLGADWVDPEYEAKAADVKQQMLTETLSGPTAAAAAVAWAQEARLSPAPVTEITVALAATETFVEDQFFTVLNRLGIDTRTTPTPPSARKILTELVGHRLDGMDVIAHQPVRGEHLSHVAAPDLLWRFGDQTLLVACGCHDEMQLRPVAVAPDRRYPYGPAAAFAGAQLTDVAFLLGTYAQAEGAALRFGERELLVHCVGGGWVTALSDSVRVGRWLT